MCSVGQLVPATLMGCTAVGETKQTGHSEHVMHNESDSGSTVCGHMRYVRMHVRMHTLSVSKEEVWLDRYAV